MAGDDRALARSERRLEHRVQIGGEVVQAVAVTPHGHRAAAVAAVVERDDAKVLRKVGDLVGPHADGAGDAVSQHDWVAVLGTEDLGVQADAVLGAHGYDASAR